jgi:hypothetical protein
VKPIVSNHERCPLAPYPALPERERSGASVDKIRTPETLASRMMRKSGFLPEVIVE